MVMSPVGYTDDNKTEEWVLAVGRGNLTRNWVSVAFSALVWLLVYRYLNLLTFYFQVSKLLLTIIRST